MKELHSIKELAFELLNKQPKIVAVTGHIGVGKNYVAFETGKLLQEYGFNVYFTSFASKLKKIIYEVFGILKDGTLTDSAKDFTNELTYRESVFTNNLIFKDGSDCYFEHRELFNKLRKIFAKVYVHNNIQTSKKVVRKLMQVLGEEIRILHGENVWTNPLIHTIENIIDYTDYTFITDLRYPNELLKLAETFGKDKITVVRVISPLNETLYRLNIDLPTYEKMLQHESETNIDKITDVDYIFVNTINTSNCKEVNNGSEES